MLRLKNLYVAVSAAALISYLALFSSDRIPYVFINIILALAAPAGYLYPGIFTSVSIAVSWLIAYPVLVFALKVDPLGAAIPLIFFDLLMAAYCCYRNIVKRERSLRHQALEKNDADKKTLSEDRERAMNFENGIKAKEAEFVKLYEITRKMSEHLKFEDIFREFSLFMKENFNFRKCDLMILDRSDEALRIERYYSVWMKDPDVNVPNNAAKNEKLMELLKARPRDIWLTKKDDASALAQLGIDAGGVETLAVLPLLSERRMVGVLAVEDLPRADFERFVILATQFALEIKKVLLYEMVEKLAITDSLTGLYVRRYFYERLDEELLRSNRYNFEFAFIMMDIDDFKKCNDTYGHMVGDVVIKDIARIIKESVRDIDIVGRYGGEEFAIALPETGYESARQVAERLRRKVEQMIFMAYDEKLKLTISLGVAMYPRDASCVSDIIERSDQALYEAKKSGKNVVCEYKR